MTTNNGITSGTGINEFNSDFNTTKPSKGGVLVGEKLYDDLYNAGRVNIGIFRTEYKELDFVRPLLDKKYLIDINYEIGIEDYKYI